MLNLLSLWLFKQNNYSRLKAENRANFTEIYDGFTKITDYLGHL